ncbi:AraC family transcriptional regulator [Paenibacillus sp. KQZ6P-2]|uniref:AraC family transcriptional regulator n=1 Tax=Paenibacillus mangrovi TaxID=2931978 RepID=A0A9X1WRW3_9BACL|nr:AraC family transcriptional regulator [Paenibacillus mangrovi]MCJ8014142.1 AraC family transcriptional regulator [Paenibacillus mangrovi]
MKKLDIEPLTRLGVIYFNSKLEMLEDLHCKMYRMDTLVSLSTHFHDYFQIWYVSKGEFLHTLGTRQYRIKKGDLFLVPPFTLHRIQAFEKEKVEILGCEFMPPFINERFDDPSGDQTFFDVNYLKHFLHSDCSHHSQIVFDGVTDGKIRNLLQDMLSEYEERTPFFQIILKANLLQLLSIIIRQVNGELVKAGFQKIERYRDTMNKVVEYIDQNAHEDMKLEHICAISNMSKPTICRLFKEWTGKTFNRYLVDLRIANALVLLQRPSLSVTEVCYATGFNELAYFCRIFKKYTGISPNQFRKQAMNK